MFLCPLHTHACGNKRVTSRRGAAIGWTDTAFQQQNTVNSNGAVLMSGAGSRSQEEAQGHFKKPVLVIFNKWDLVSEQPFQLGRPGPCIDESADESAERWLAGGLPGPAGTSRSVEQLLGKWWWIQSSQAAYSSKWQ